jgi:predicted nuclease of predicted toxin-antitoxin system
VSRPRFLADHDLNEAIIDGVVRREPAVEIIRAREVGLAGRPDEEVLEYAAHHGLIVVSHDVNTMPAHAALRLTAHLPFPGLLMIRQSLPLGTSIDQMLKVWSASEAEEWAGLVAFLPL